VYGSRNVAAKRLGVAPEQVHVVSPFVGGGFGCKGFPWGHSVLAAVAARRVGRPVKIALTRQQMFTSNGHRARTVQRLALGAERSGALTALRHVTTTQTSQVDEFIEPAGLTSRFLYACPNVEVAHNLVRVNTGTPTPMRAPGESPGLFALESALDELSYKLGMDPVALRLANHAEVNQQTGKPFSSKHLRACYAMGAELIGWERRRPEPGTTRDGRHWVGYGMATATYPANRFPCAARLAVYADGTAAVHSATHDIGTGTYTAMTQIAAELLGLPPERVTAVLGDSRLPQAPVSGGSTTAASLSAAIHAASEALRGEMLKRAGWAGSPLQGLGADAVRFADGALVAEADPGRRVSLAEIVRRSGGDHVEAVAESAPDSEERFAFQSFGAQFAEVRVDADLGEVRVVHFASVHDVGTVLNEKTARSQVYSGVIQGIGMALMEETLLDPRTGRVVTRNLADYHVPVCLDVPDIAVRFVGVPDPHMNALGVRGIGEIGITGVAAAVANAVCHATGVRVRNLPITPDKLLGIGGEGNGP
jgi:xanthine dehydrogenase YagR molybdenum-binding subunit